MKKRVLVVGHKNPDSDSVCSAIAYAYFKNLVDKARLYIPCMAGAINKETKYILERFDIETPMVIDSVVATVNDMDLKGPITASPEDCIRDIGRLIRRKNIRSLPVIDSGGKLLGIVGKEQLSEHYIERVEIEDLSVTPINLNVLLAALNGKILANTGKVELLTGKIFIAAAQRGTILNRIRKGDIVIIGDRTDVQIDLIKAGCSALIITGESPVSEEVLALARREQVLIVSSSYYTFATAKLINLSAPVVSIMSRDVPVAGLRTPIVEIKAKVMESKYRCVLIVDEGDRLISIITRTDLLEPIQKQVILVDHNEISQAVDGIEQADILEIIDHHRVGDISTLRPITVYNEPIGSTCTIIANLMFLHQVEFPSNIAGALLSGILSDTLLLTLSTATEKDREVADKLLKTSRLDLNTFGKELLKSSIDIKGKTPKEILFRDFKEYVLRDKKVGVSQTMVLDDAETATVEEGIKVEMEKLCQTQGYSLVVFLILNPLQKKGEQIFVKGEKEIIEKTFGVTVKDDKCFIPEILSRKKDFIPKIGSFLMFLS
ncbi:MAG: putative manganese-dependent inorganic diphosphatase [Deltaproteobacteria bacterium]|nr:putative manganese-dependent inorganic diphosphatase [Deltaproteobacteria bacterium]MBW1795533.1 putative manganese-dependent inorganic diphosphatase [Deltaproteobacteria bacterium]